MLLLLCFILAMSLIVVGAPPAQQAYAASANVTVDFASRVDYPLVKSKFGVYNTPYVQPARWFSDFDMIKDLRPARIRLETAWGKEGTGTYYDPMVTGTSGNLQYNFSQIDSLIDLSQANGIPFFMAATYTPTPLIPGGGSWMSPPSDINLWGNGVVNAFANHFKQTGRKVSLYELWNEPDLTGIFFSGSQSDYHEIYRRGVEGIRSADPDAAVGGPVLAFDGWQASFLNFVQTNSLPLDAFTYHHYGSPQDSKVYNMRNALSASYDFSTVDTDITEYNYILDFSPGTPVIRYQAAANLLNSFKGFLEQPWVNHVDWAQMQEPDCDCDRIGLLDLNGQPRAAYNAFKIYADMPVDRRSMSISGSVDGMASADDHKASVVLWNLSGSSQSVDVALNNIPFPTGNLRVYRIDANNASITDNPASPTLVPVEQYLSVSTSGYTWNGSIPNEAVVYLEFEDGTGLHELDQVAVGDVIKVNNYMPDRTKSSYSMIDSQRWTGYLGMGNEDWADAEVGIVAENLPDIINAQFTVDGTLQNKDANSLLGLRVDYQVGSSYTKGVLYHGGLYNSTRYAPMPWGTKAQADQVIQVPSLSNFDINLAANAPHNWNGRVTITLIMQNAGAGTRAKVRINGNSLESWYKLDESAGTSLHNSAKSVNDGSASATSWTAGRLGNALAFNGSSSYATVPRNAADSFSIAFWVNTSQTGSTSCGEWYCGTGLVDSEVGGVTNDFGVVMLGSKAAFGVGNPDKTITSGKSINDGQWHHIAATRSAADGTIRLYVDGKLEAADTAGTQALTASSDLSFGRIHTGFNYFNGLLDDVRFYRGVLSPSQIQSLASGNSF